MQSAGLTLSVLFHARQAGGPLYPSATLCKHRAQYPAPDVISTEAPRTGGPITKDGFLRPADSIEPDRSLPPSRTHRQAD